VDVGHLGVTHGVLLEEVVVRKGEGNNKKKRDDRKGKPRKNLLDDSELDRGGKITNICIKAEFDS
jgi:hypothetical protein